MSSFWASLSTSQPSQSQQDADDLAQAQASAAAAAAASQSLFSQSSLGSQLFGSAYGSQPELSQQSGAEQSDHADHNEVCLICGSTSFLTDDATGVTVCAQCHTQSQTLSQVEVVGEEDVEALAARTMGRMVSRRIGGKKRQIASVEEIDNSVKLPGVEECIGGFQYLLQRAAECAADLVGLEDGMGGDDDDSEDDDEENTNGRQMFIDIVGNIWFGYLTSWQRGAKKYSKLHPEVRFSIRDAFLGQTRKDMILRHLSVRCCEEIRANEEQLERINKRIGKGRGQKRRRGGQAASTSTNANANTNTENPSSDQDKRAIFGSVGAMLDSLPSKEIDDKIAALRLTPSLSLIGSIIHLALTVLRSGVTSHQIVGWAASGAFPYLTNAYRQLSAEFKHTLKPTKAFFTQHLPPPGLLDYQADILSIACGMKLGQLSRSSSGGVDNIPLLVTRMVSDLGFDKKVLDYTFSLLGLRDLPPPDQEWAPRPLVKNMRRLSSPLHVMAVIVVAVRMCEGWENRTYHVTTESASGSTKNDQSKQHKKTNVFIPSSNAQLHQLSNDQLGEYLDFLESNVFDKHSRRSAMIKPFVNSLLEVGKRHAKTLKKDEDGRPSSAGAVRPNTIVAGAKIFHEHEQKKSVSVADDEDVTYTIYQSCLTSRTPGDDHTEPGFLDPHYALLIEYVAYKADAEPSDLHSLVALLDKEIFEKVSKRDNDLREQMADAKRSCQPVTKMDKLAHQNKRAKRIQPKADVRRKETQQLNLFRCTNPAASIYHGAYQQHMPKPTMPESTKPPSKPIKPPRKNRRCSVEGCEKEGIKKFRYMCKVHYNRSNGKESTHVDWKALLK